MSSLNEDDRVTATTRTLQFITGALTVGPLFFLVIVLSIKQTPKEGQPIITAVGIVLAVTTLAIRLILPRLIVARERRRLAQEAAEASPGNADLIGPLCALYQRMTILGATLIEGVAFLMVIAYFLEGTPPALVLSILLILGVATHVPTRSRIERWIERQIGLIEEERQLAR